MSDAQETETPKITHHQHKHFEPAEKLARRVPRKKFREKGCYELAIFLAAIVTGTACSIFGKVLYGMQGVGTNNKVQYFDKPLFQSLAMFAAMVVGIPLHWIVVVYRIPFPGYQHPEHPEQQNTTNPVMEERTQLFLHIQQEDGYGAVPTFTSDFISDDKPTSTSHSLPFKLNLILALLSIFDLAATALCSIGLLYLDVSVYQMLRGSSIIYVALLRQYGLRQRLFRFQWIGVLYNVLSVVLVGAAALRGGNENEETMRGGGALFGVGFMLAGTFVQALQFALEEKIMVHDQVKVPPLLLFGMEGVWGFVFSLVLLYPIGYMVPGHDNGHYEDPFNTFTILWNTPSLQLMVALYMLAIFGYNLFAVLVTFSLSSIWHSILDNFRPLTVWVVDLIIFGFTKGGFGEAWTSNSWIELVGLAVLLYGTAIFNAPDAGSIQLKGQWFSLGFDFEKEYMELSAQRMFSMGSYPSLHRFLSKSLRESDSQRFQDLTEPQSSSSV